MAQSYRLNAKIASKMTNMIKITVITEITMLPVLSSFSSSVLGGFAVCKMETKLNVKQMFPVCLGSLVSMTHACNCMYK